MKIILHSSLIPWLFLWHSHEVDICIFSEMYHWILNPMLWNLVQRFILILCVFWLFYKTNSIQWLYIQRFPLKIPNHLADPCQGHIYSAVNYTICVNFYSRQAPKHWELGAGPAVRDIQCSERKAPATSQPLDQTAGHPVRHLPHRILCQREPDGEDAHPAAHRRKST